MKFTHDFKQDLELIINEVENGEPFAFGRFADGEHAVLEGLPLKGMDWKMKPEYTQARAAMNKALDYREPRYFYGVSCRCCDPAKAQYYKDKLQDCPERVTYSNIFVNGNYKRTLEWLKTTKRKVVIIGNRKIRGDKLGTVLPTLPVDRNYIGNIPDNSLASYEGAQGRAGGYMFPIPDAIDDTEPKLVLFAAGPMSEILMQKFHEHMVAKDLPTHYLIDIGSVLDPWIHGSDTRIYHHHPHWQQLSCFQLFP